MADCNSIYSTECSSVECNSLETSNLYNQQFRLNKIIEIKNYFIAEIKKRELMSKRLSKYIASFYCFEKSFIVLSATSVTVAAVIRTPVGIASASPRLRFSLSTRLVKKLLKTTKNKKKET